MWMLRNRTPYAAGRNWTRDKKGMPVWIVALKATFDVGADGKLTLADEQQPPALDPEYRGDPNKTSLRTDSDLLAVKPGTDVLLDAVAHAPRARPTQTVEVSLRVDRLEKTLLVHGTRVYYRGAAGLTTTAARPFVTQPIEWEWAFGGVDTHHKDPSKHRMDMRNPIGKGFALDPKVLENQPAHSIEYPRGNPAKVGPAGFGPLTSFWSPRLERSGTYDAAWEKTRKPLLPADYDPRASLAAPDDQRPQIPLRGGETMVLENLTPEGRLAFRLPTVIPAFATYVARRTVEHAGILATVYFATETKKLTLVWQTSLSVPSRDVQHLDFTEIREMH